LISNTAPLVERFPNGQAATEEETLGSIIEHIRDRSFAAASLTGLVVLMPLGAMAQDQQPNEAPLAQKTPARGYLEAHRGVQEPVPLLGGPVEVTLRQDGGQAFVALPDNRELDPVVFGTPDMPLAYGGFPVVQGVPPEMRGTEGGQYTQLKQKSPFGDAHIVLPGAKLELTALDATAADAATSDDQVEMTASWQDEAGNTYTVTCCKQLQTAGTEHPTFGGVVTNHIMHGFSRVGTPLFPTVIAQLGFWGAGEIMKNGEVIDGPRPVHGMLTEYARTGNYELAFDENVTPTARHFHVMVAPVVPGDEPGALKRQPVETGFELPNGQTLPFWHVMFENVDVQSQRQGG
jgi:hypothetical protein